MTKEKRNYRTDAIIRELDIFKKYNCKNCKNKGTDKCEIRRNIQGRLMCIFMEV